MKGYDMSNGNGRGNGRFDARLRVLLALVALVAAAVVFAWSSQAGQDERIARNEKAVAVIEARLGSIGEKLDDLKELLLRDKQ